MDDREAIEGLQTQDSRGKKVYGFDVTGLKDATDTQITPASPTILEVRQESDDVDKKADIMPAGSPTISGNVVIMPVAKSMVKGEVYRIYFDFTDGGSNTFVRYIRVYCPE